MFGRCRAPKAPPPLCFSTSSLICQPRPLPPLVSVSMADASLPRLLQPSSVEQIKRAVCTCELICVLVVGSSLRVSRPYTHTHTHTPPLQHSHACVCVCVSTCLCLRLLLGEDKLLHFSFILSDSLLAGFRLCLLSARSPSAPLHCCYASRRKLRAARVANGKLWARLAIRCTSLCLPAVGWLTCRAALPTFICRPL